MDRILLPFRQSKLLNTLFLSNFFVSFHYALVIYINSSFLSKFYSEAQVSSLYIIGSILDTILLLNASKILEKFGSYKFTIYAITLEFISTAGLMLSESPFWSSIFFLIHVFTISLILFNLDVFVESVSKDESQTGEIRATYLTITNITITLAPIFVALLVFDSNYSKVYFIAVLFLLPLYYYLKRFKNLIASPIKHIRVKETISEYIKNRDLFDIFISQSILQFFYGFMVIYVPIYLSKYVGFSWNEIGIMFTIMLLPFVLFELPIGEMADYKYGEKEFLTIGFVVMGLSTIFISFITAKIFWVWTTILFISRIGASFVEISSESYFFKHVNQEKTDFISLFRISRPISFITAPAITTIALGFIPFQYVFIIIGGIVIIGTHYSLRLNDTK
jgi:MFS family permease